MQINGVYRHAPLELQEDASSVCNACFRRSWILTLDEDWSWNRIAQGTHDCTNITFLNLPGVYLIQIVLFVSISLSENIQRSVLKLAEGIHVGSNEWHTELKWRENFDWSASCRIHLAHTYYQHKKSCAESCKSHVLVFKNVELSWQFQRNFPL